MTIQTSSFTQGGQTSLHKLRMLKQVAHSTLRISLFSGLITFLIHHFWTNYYLNWIMLPAWAWAKFVYDFKSLLPKLDEMCFYIRLPQCVIGTCSSSWFLDPEAYPQIFLRLMAENAMTGLFWATIAFFVTGGLAIWYFLRKGAELKQTRALSGFDLLDLKGYKEHLKSLKMKSSLLVDGIPIPESAEVKHFMVAGTTGSGKTNFLNHLLKSIRERGDRAVIVDTTGGFVSKFYDDTTDVILNPFDARGKNWNLWGEGLSQAYHFENIAECLIPDSNASDQFWVTAPRQALAEALEIIKTDEEPSIESLLKILLKDDLTKTSKFFLGSEVASLFSPQSEKTALSIRSVLSNHLKVLRAITEDKNSDGFSIIDWFDKQEQGFLFLTSTIDQRAFMRPLLSAWLSISIKALMNKEPDSGRRVWFIIDELASLNKLPQLETALAEIRKYGGCMVLSFQDIAQVEDIYGRMATRAMSGLTVSKVFFQTSEQSNAVWLSSQLGQHEVMEANENVSFGANEIRDGVSLTHHKMLKPVVPPNDLLLLNPLECFMKTADTKAVLKHKLSYLNLSSRAAAFLPKPTVHKKRIHEEQDLPVNVTYIHSLGIDKTLEQEDKGEALQSELESF